MIHPINKPAGYPFGASPYPLLIKNPDGTTFGWKHGGQDYPAPVGTPVYAPHKGTVIMAMRNGTAGNEVRIANGGMVTRLLHLNSYIVPNGRAVAEGQLIGYSGKTGYTTGPHLHWGLSVNGKYVNPILYVTPPKPPVNSHPYAWAVGKTVYLTGATWRVYKVGSVSPRTPVGTLLPNKYGGLSYKILATDKSLNSVVINTQSFGQVSLPLGYGEKIK